MIGHLADKCYKFHGYPPTYKLYNKASNSNTFVNSISIEQEEEDYDNIALTRGQ